MQAAEVIEVLHSLHAAGVPAGVTGGWGIDALLRRETRLHRDLDLGIPEGRIVAAVTALSALGYRVTKDQRPARLGLRSERGAVDLHPIAWDDRGDGIQAGFNGQTFRYPRDSLDAEGIIGGQAVRCATVALQVDFHVGFEPTDIDRMDIAALVSEFGVALPPQYQSRLPPGA